jgi:propionate CoA-transferase
MEENYYTTVTRYSTGAFLRMKLGDALTKRDVAPHIFETEDDARAFLANA